MQTPLYCASAAYITKVPWMSSLKVQILFLYFSRNRKALWFPKSSNWIRTDLPNLGKQVFPVKILMYYKWQVPYMKLSLKVFTISSQTEVLYTNGVTRHKKLCFFYDKENGESQGKSLLEWCWELICSIHICNEPVWQQVTEPATLHQ